MTTAAHTTSFARLRPRTAQAVLALTLFGCTASVALSLSPLRLGRADSQRQHAGDVALYRAVVDRQQQGASYYSAIAAELTARGYPTRSVFNWRMPPLLVSIGALPEPHLARAFLGVLALAALLLGFAMLARQFGTGTAACGGVLLAGAALPCILGELYLMSELWAGALIGLSLAAYGTDRRRLGMAAGLAAVFIRELALPYAVVCLFISAFERRGREACFWLVGLTAYAVLLAAHVSTVMTLIDPSARAHDHGWICLGGWPFLIALAQMNAWLLVAPQWLAALYLPLAVLGLAAWPTQSGLRLALTGAGYLAAFALVGQPFNQYWGSLLTFVLCFGAAAAPVALRDLWRAALASAPAAGRVCSRPA